MSFLAQNNHDFADMRQSPPAFLPEMDMQDPIEKIRDAFFAHDCVLLRRALNPDKIAYFRRLCEEMYREDDAIHVSGREMNEKWRREFANGWIWEDRLRAATGNAFGYEDIVANPHLFHVLDAIMGNNWAPKGASQIRRMAARPQENPWCSQTDYHLDTQWGADWMYCVNVWTPFTPCGLTASALEFLLSSADCMKAYSEYDPSIPSEPRGPLGINPRMNYEVFNPAIIQKNFHVDRFWLPVFEPGDVMLFSGWCAHRTAVLPQMTQTRISLEWRVFLKTFDTPMRPKMW